jgi:hypothetical protein
VIGADDEEPLVRHPPQVATPVRRTSPAGSTGRPRLASVGRVGGAPKPVSLPPVDKQASRSIRTGLSLGRTASVRAAARFTHAIVWREQRAARKRSCAACHVRRSTPMPPRVSPRPSLAWTGRYVRSPRSRRGAASCDVRAEARDATDPGAHRVAGCRLWLQSAEVLAGVVLCECLAEHGREVDAVVVEAHVVAEEIAAGERGLADVE